MQYSIANAADFLNYLRERFVGDSCLRAAAALSYTTLVALVPLFTVAFSAISVFPAFEQWRGVFEDFLFENFVPALGMQIRDYLVQFTDKARGLQAFGTAFLIVTVIAMLATVESTFNVIWRVPRRRPLLVRMLVYWAVLTLGPVLIGASIVVSSYLVSLPLIGSSATVLQNEMRALGAFPLVATTLAFILFFKVIPYRPVPIRHAIVGGIVAGVLFELAKRAFAFYVTHFPSQQAVYGAFAAVPIFLLWIYLSWVIVLLGAEVTQCLTTFPLRSRSRAGGMPDSTIYAAFRILRVLFDAQQHGQALADRPLYERASGPSFNVLNTALERLDSERWVSRNDTFEWILVRDLDRLTLVDLMSVVPAPVVLDKVTGLDVDDADARFFASLREHRRWLEGQLSSSLAALMVPAESAPPGQLRDLA